MNDLLDLERFPVDRLDCAATTALIARCRRELGEHGMFNLDGFVRPLAIRQAAAEIQALCTAASYTHQRSHNVYFEERIEGLPADHGALRRFDTINHTLCGDQLDRTIVQRIYEWTPLPAFVARVIDKPQLHLMADPLARVNAMEYRSGEGLNWHFDRAQFTTTLLVQPADAGGEFEFVSGLRSDTDPNYDGVARLLRGEVAGIQVNPLSAGTLNVFAGRNTLHRVSPVRGARSRLIAVYSYYEVPGVLFSPEERIGFYGRAG